MQLSISEEEVSEFVSTISAKDAPLLQPLLSSTGKPSTDNGL